MDATPLMLTLLAAVILVGAIGENITKKTQIPDVIWLILLGIILGPVSGLVDTEALKNSGGGVQLFASITLIIVLFEGGSRLKVMELVNVAPRAAFLSVTGFIITVTSVAVISAVIGPLLIPEWSFLHGVMLGAIVGGSSSLIVMPSMSLSKLDKRVSNLVGLESALTDALCVVVTLATISLLVASEQATSSPLATLGQQFGIAILVGCVSAWCWLPIMKLLRDSPHAYPVTLSALIVLYVSVEQLGGSAALGILAFAIIVGNASTLAAKVDFLPTTPIDLTDSVRDVHSNVAFVIKSLFFCFIGLMIGPPWSMVIAGVILGLLLLAVRIPAVKLATRGAGFTKQQQGVITVSLPRGMAAGVLATIPHVSGVEGTEHLPPLVFAAVVTTIVVFAVGFPILSRVNNGPEEYLPPTGADDSLEVTIAAGSDEGGPEEATPEVNDSEEVPEEATPEVNDSEEITPEGSDNGNSEGSQPKNETTKGEE